MDKFIYYGVLSCAGLAVLLAFVGFDKKQCIFEYPKIKENSILRKIPGIRVLVKADPRYVRVIPIIVSFAIMIVVLPIYICFWIYPPLVADFLANKWVLWVMIGYDLAYFVLSIIN